MKPIKNQSKYIDYYADSVLGIITSIKSNLDI